MEMQKRVHGGKWGKGLKYNGEVGKIERERERKKKDN